MAGGAAEDSLLQPVPFVQVKLGEDVFMASEARFGRAGLQQVRIRLGRMNGMAGGAIQGSFAVGAGHEPGTVVGMALQAGFGFLRGKIGRFEGENIGPAAFLEVFLGTRVARRAAGRSDGRVGLMREALDGVFMALAAGLGVLRRLLD